MLYRSLESSYVPNSKEYANQTFRYTVSLGTSVDKIDAVHAFRRKDPWKGIRP